LQIGFLTTIDTKTRLYMKMLTGSLVAFFLCLAQPSLIHGQTSNIVLDSSDSGNIEVRQTSDTSLKSNIALKKSDSAKILVDQAVMQGKNQQKSGFMDFVNNTYVIILAITALISLIILVRKYIKKRKKKEQE
jgi:hypothetical protein